LDWSWIRVGWTGWTAKLRHWQSLVCRKRSEVLCLGFVGAWMESLLVSYFCSNKYNCNNMC
jgi:hypothetical protein